MWELVQDLNTWQDILSMMAIALFMMKDETFYLVKLGSYKDTRCAFYTK